MAPPSTSLGESNKSLRLQLSTLPEMLRAAREQLATANAKVVDSQAELGEAQAELGATRARLQDTWDASIDNMRTPRVSQFKPPTSVKTCISKTVITPQSGMTMGRGVRGCVFGISKLNFFFIA